jgi:hypothetical protein
VRRLRRCRSRRRRASDATPGGNAVVETTRSRTRFATHGCDVPICVSGLVVLLPDLRQRTISVFLPWDLGKVDCLTAPELGDVESIGCCGADVVGELG